MKNKKNCTHKYGFKRYDRTLPDGKKVIIDKCKRCKKRFVIE